MHSTRALVMSFSLAALVATGACSSSSNSADGAGASAPTSDASTDTGATAPDGATPTGDTGVPVEGGPSVTDTGVPAEGGPSVTDTGVPAESGPTVTDSGPPSDSASPTPDASGDGGACNTLDFGQPETAIVKVTSLPTMTGGTIASGIYDMIKAETTGTATVGYVMRSTWSFAATTMDMVNYSNSRPDGGTPPTPGRATWSYSTSGIDLTRSVVCGTPQTSTTQYTVTTSGADTLLQVSSSGILMLTFKKR